MIHNLIRKGRGGGTEERSGDIATGGKEKREDEKYKMRADGEVMGIKEEKKREEEQR